MVTLSFGLLASGAFGAFGGLMLKAVAPTEPIISKVLTPCG